MKKVSWALIGASMAMAADEVQQAGVQMKLAVFSLSLKELVIKWAISLGWIVVAAIGFSFGVGLSIKVFDWLSKDIDEWEEVKKGNLIVGGILISLIVMIGLIVLKIL